MKNSYLIFYKYSYSADYRNLQEGFSTLFVDDGQPLLSDLQSQLQVDIDHLLNMIIDSVYDEMPEPKFYERTDIKVLLTNVIKLPI